MSLGALEPRTRITMTLNIDFATKQRGNSPIDQLCPTVEHCMGICQRILSVLVFIVLQEKKRLIFQPFLANIKNLTRNKTFLLEQFWKYYYW